MLAEKDFAVIERDFGVALMESTVLVESMLQVKDRLLVVD